MSLNNIVYPELRSQMALKKITISQMAADLNMDRLTLSRRLTGKVALPFDTSLAIKNMFFPCMELERLFTKEETCKK